MGRLHALRIRLAVAALRLFSRLGKIFLPKTPPTRVLFIPSADGIHNIRLLIHDPPNNEAGAPKPVHVTFHGSGFILPSLGANSRFCALLARELDCIVVDADYRKAPEHPFPTPYNDAVTVLQWVLSNPDNQFDTSRISMGGFSAGANIALGVCASLSEGTIKAVIAFYPVTDPSKMYGERPPPPRGKAESGMAIPVAVGALMREAYLGDHKDLTDPRLSPLLAEPSRFPAGGKTLVVTCEYDYLRLEGDQFKDRLVQGGREPEYLFAKGMGHGWDTTAKDGTNAGRLRDEAYIQAMDVLQRAYAESSEIPDGHDVLLAT